MVGKIKCLVFSGGGIRGISYVGCLQALEEYQVISQVECFVGTSAGSIFALLLNLGYKYEELHDILLTIDFDNLKDITSDGIFNYFNSYGFETGNKLERIVKIFIRKKVTDDNITFKELFQKTGKQLIVTGTCLNTRQCEYFSYLSHPDMPVIKAIRISISIPFVFIAQKIAGNLYVDGGVIENYPLNAYNNKDEILGFLLKDKVGNKEIEGLDGYSLAIIQCIDNKLYDLYLMLYHDITITINTEIGVLDYTISREMKSKLFSLGYKQTLQYLKQNSDRIINDNDNNIDTSKLVVDINKEIMINNQDKLNNIETEFIIKEETPTCLDLEHPTFLDLENITVENIIDITTVQE